MNCPEFRTLDQIFPIKRLDLSSIKQLIKMQLYHFDVFACQTDGQGDAFGVSISASRKVSRFLSIIDLWSPNTAAATTTVTTKAMTMMIDHFYYDLYYYHNYYNYYHY